MTRFPLNRLIGSAFVTMALLTLAPVSGVARDAEPPQLSWPAPPEPARIVYVRAIEDERDLKGSPSALSRMFRALTGSRAKGSRLFGRPTDVYAQDSTLLFVTDAAAQQLFLIDLRAKRFEAIGADGTGMLMKPMGLAGDGAGHVYCADATGRRVAVFDMQGRFVRNLGSPLTLLNPVDVAVEPGTRRVYVADSHQHQVVVFDSAGRVVRRIGKHEGDIATKDSVRAIVRTMGDEGEHPRLLTGSADVVQNRGSGPGEFLYPVAVTIGPQGNVYVSDGLNGRVQVFDADGGYLRHFGHLADTPGSFARPKGIASDSQGHVYVVDAAFNNIQIFDDSGLLLLAFGKIGTGTGEFWLPLGIHVDAHDRIYVADRYNGRVQVFRYIDVPESDSGEQGALVTSPAR